MIAVDNEPPEDVEAEVVEIRLIGEDDALIDRLSAGAPGFDELTALLAVWVREIDG